MEEKWFITDVNFYVTGGTKMTKILGEKAEKLDCSLLTGSELKQLSSEFEKEQVRAKQSNPRLKEVKIDSWFSDAYGGTGEGKVLYGMTINNGTIRITARKVLREGLI